MAQEIKRLYRSRASRMLGGVAGGLAEYLDADVTIIRLIFALSVVFSFGSAILIYFIMWVVVPEAPIAAPASKSSTRRKTS